MTHDGFLRGNFAELLTLKKTKTHLLMSVEELLPCFFTRFIGVISELVF